MKVKCFGCDALIEADDSDTIADAFVAHGQEKHTWSYREDAIRNYARNYADATDRLTGDTARLPEIADITVQPQLSSRMTIAACLKTSCLPCAMERPPSVNSATSAAQAKASQSGVSEYDLPRKNVLRELARISAPGTNSPCCWPLGPSI